MPRILRNDYYRLLSRRPFVITNTVGRGRRPIEESQTQSGEGYNADTEYVADESKFDMPNIFDPNIDATDIGVKTNAQERHNKIIHHKLK